MKTFRGLIISALLLSAHPAPGQSTFNMCPLPLRQYYDTGQCLAPDTCIFSGIQVGMVSDATSSQVPQITYGVESVNDLRGSGNANVLGGMNAQSTFEVPNGLLDNYLGFNSYFALANGADAIQVTHFSATEVLFGFQSTITSDIGLLYAPAPATTEKITVFSADPTASIRHAGPLRIGAIGAPTSGIDCDVVGPLHADAGQVGPTPTATSTATPTGVTPTATAATPTPTATETPDFDVTKYFQVKGKVHVTGTSALDDAVTLRKDQNAATVDLVQNASTGTLAFADQKVATNGATGYLRAYSSTFLGGAPLADSVALICDTDTSACHIYEGANVPMYFWTNALQRWKITANGHLISTGPDPVLSACGTTPVFVGGDDMQGRFTTGTGVVTACTLTFAGAYVNAPKCNIQNETTIAAVQAVASTFAFTVVAAASQTFSYDCHGFE